MLRIPLPSYFHYIFSRGYFVHTTSREFDSVTLSTAMAVRVAMKFTNAGVVGSCIPLEGWVCTLPCIEADSSPNACC